MRSTSHTILLCILQAARIFLVGLALNQILTASPGDIFYEFIRWTVLSFWGIIFLSVAIYVES